MRAGTNPTNLRLSVRTLRSFAHSGEKAVMGNDTNRRRGVLVALGLLAAGCAATPTDEPWTAARAACGLGADQTFPFEFLLPPGDGSLHGLSLPPGCPDTLLRTFGADPERMMRDLRIEQSLDEHVELVRQGDTAPDGIVTLTWGAAWLLGADLGRVDAIDAGPFSDVTWTDDLRRLAEAQGASPDSPLSKVLFVEAAAEIRHVRWLPPDAPDDATMALYQPGDTLRVPRTFVAEDGSQRVVPSVLAWSLFHESVHGRPSRFRHVPCLAPASATGRVCDESGDAAYGAGFAVAWAEVRAATGPDGCAEGGLEWLVNADLNAMIESWEKHIIAPVPAHHTPSCE